MILRERLGRSKPQRKNGSMRGTRASSRYHLLNGYFSLVLNFVFRWLLDSLDPVGDLDEDEPAVNNIEPAVIDPAPTPTVAKPIEVDDTPVEVTPVKTRTKRKGKATAQPVTSPEETVEPAPMAVPAPVATPSRKQPLRLPNPNSSAWQTTELPPAPLETPGSTRKTRSRAKETA